MEGTFVDIVANVDQTRLDWGVQIIPIHFADIVSLLNRKYIESSIGSTSVLRVQNVIPPEDDISLKELQFNYLKPNESRHFCQEKVISTVMTTKEWIAVENSIRQNQPKWEQDLSILDVYEWCFSNDFGAIVCRSDHTKPYYKFQSRTPAILPIRVYDFFCVVLVERPTTFVVIRDLKLFTKTSKCNNIYRHGFGGSFPNFDFLHKKKIFYYFIKTCEPNTVLIFHPSQFFFQIDHQPARSYRFVLNNIKIYTGYIPNCLCIKNYRFCSECFHKLDTIPHSNFKRKHMHNMCPFCNEDLSELPNHFEEHFSFSNRRRKIAKKNIVEPPCESSTSTVDSPVNQEEALLRLQESTTFKCEVTKAIENIPNDKKKDQNSISSVTSSIKSPENKTKSKIFSEKVDISEAETQLFSQRCENFVKSSDDERVCNNDPLRNSSLTPRQAMDSNESDRETTLSQSESESNCDDSRASRTESYSDDESRHIFFRKKFQQKKKYLKKRFISPKKTRLSDLPKRTGKPAHFFHCRKSMTVEHEKFQPVTGVSPHEPIVSPQEPIASPQEPIASPQEPIASPQEPIASPQNNYKPIASPQEPIASPHNNHKPIASPHNNDKPIASPQKPIAPQGDISQNVNELPSIRYEQTLLKTQGNQSLDLSSHSQYSCIEERLPESNPIVSLNPPTNSQNFCEQVYDNPNVSYPQFYNSSISQVYDLTQFNHLVCDYSKTAGMFDSNLQYNLQTGQTFQGLKLSYQRPDLQSFHPPNSPHVISNASSPAPWYQTKYGPNEIHSLMFPKQDLTPPRPCSSYENSNMLESYASYDNAGAQLCPTPSTQDPLHLLQYFSQQ